MGVNSKDMLDLLYNRKLPQVYRDEDRKIEYPLKRYLESLIDGGYCGSIKDIEDTLLLIDPDKIPDKFFPYLCESFGLTYLPDMDITYQRKFLSNVGELNKRRGTFSCVHFLIRALTGLDAELSYEGSTLSITLLAKNLSQVDSIDVSMEVIRNYIKTQIPYFVSPEISSRIETQVIKSKSYNYSLVGTYKSYIINSKGV